LNTLGNRTKTTSAIIVVLLMASLTLMANVPVQPVQAQVAADQQFLSPPSGVTPVFTLDTVAFLSFTPNPIGVGQPLLVNTWITPAIQAEKRIMSTITGACKLTITKPDGNKEVITLPSTMSEASSWTNYVPEQVGEYKLKFDFYGTYFPGGYYYNGYLVTNTTGNWYNSTYYQPSSTAEQTLTVQQDFVWSWPPSPLPTDYWTRPVNDNNREWWPILGNYPGTGYVGGGSTWDAFYPDTNPYDSPPYYNLHPWVQGPNSAHIVWKRQNAVAGLIGGPAGIYGTTSSPGNPSVVYAGRAYQTVTKPGVGSVAQCYDLRTGQIYYEIPTAQGGVTPSYIQYVSPTASTIGVSALVGASGTYSVEFLSISGGRLMKVNPWTGALTLNVSIAPLTTGAYYKNGYCWSVQTLGDTTNPIYRLLNWTTYGTSSTLAARIMSNITWLYSATPGATMSYPPQYNMGPFNLLTTFGSILPDYTTGLAAFANLSMPWASWERADMNLSAVSLTTGQVQWSILLPKVGLYAIPCWVADHGKVAFLTGKGHWLAYDLRSGQLAWQSEDMEYPWGAASFGAYAVQSAYGMLFRQSYDGVYAFNWTNGKIVWKYSAPADAPYESPYIENGTGVYPFNSGGVIADGKMYVGNSEHSESQPLTRGWGVHCINITTGEGIWNISLPGTVGAIADGYETVANSRDGYMYVFGKGQSATTVTAPDVVMPEGNGIVIKGTVLDMSPAQPGTPCVSKDSMELQMEYLHKQMPIGGIWGNETLTGVPVTLSALDSNGTYVSIGTVTTDGYYGTFSMAWTPPKQDTYKILASFAGDDSYGSSGASTAVSVGPAPVTIEPQPQAQVPDYTMTIIGVGIAVIIAVVIAVAAAVLLLRKR